MAIDKEQIIIYLSGSVEKNSEDTNDVFWSQEDVASIEADLNEYEVIFLNPNDSFATKDRKAKFGRDIYQVLISDVVIVDAREKRGIGIGAEMAIAKYNKIPVLAYLPMNCHYRKSNISIKGMPFEDWTHPFISELCDEKCPTLEELSKSVVKYVSQKAKPIDSSLIEAAVQYYKDKFLPSDDYMRSSLRKIKKVF